MSGLDLPHVQGIGLSDNSNLAHYLTRAFSYQNTYYHQEPLLDICRPSSRWIESVDFLLSSDVFEHVPSPVEKAFEGACKVLRPGGLLVLTVPCDARAQTTEHFPNVRNFRILDFESEWLLLGKTPEGAFEVHRDLIFHGGPGTTVELRFFSENHVIKLLEDAGFHDIRVHKESVPEFGIFPPHHEGLPITARK
ncbi:class I SAM-dependent methyltransferase [Sphingobium indicum]|uniref:class I SAM-dependent methyltransferase n=1 Tax=Sphingobium indicum TaxID=332055 RepID=UPI0018C9E0A8|nr:methyltransferase domain-containing protein [Sphingobium indicum]